MSCVLARQKGGLHVQEAGHQGLPRDDEPVGSHASEADASDSRSPRFGIGVVMSAGEDPEGACQQVPSEDKGEPQRPPRFVIDHDPAGTAAADILEGLNLGQRRVAEE